MGQKKCYIYLRVSTEMQVDGFSLDAQRTQLIKYAQFHDMEIVGEYCDAGKSGKNITGRPQFQQMLEDVANGKDDVSYILVFKLSRFGRNAADILNSLQYIQDFDANLICVQDGIDSSKETGKLMITVLSAVSELERENILVQTMEGRKQKAREGKWNGGPAPYGYRLDPQKGTLQVEQEEAQIVRQIFWHYVHEDMGVDKICNYLNQHGYKKPKYRDRELDYFTRSFVLRILDNPVYVGKIAYGKSTTEKIRGVRNQYHRVKSQDYILADGRHEPIISEQLWRDARAKRIKTGIKWDKIHSLDHEHILSGIVKCPICGKGLAGTVRRKKNKNTGTCREDFYYRCLHRTKIDAERFCYFRGAINQEKLNWEVEQAIRDITVDETCRDFVLKKMEDAVDIQALEKEKERLEKQLQQVRGAKGKLTDTIDQLDVSDRHYERKYQDMQKRLDQLCDQICDLEDLLEDVERKIRSAHEEQLSVEQIYKILDNFDRVYDKMTDLEKKEFMHRFLDSVEIYPNRREDGHFVRQINFKFPVYYKRRNKADHEEAIESIRPLGNRQSKPDSYVDLSLDMEDYRSLKGKRK